LAEKAPLAERTAALFAAVSDRLGEFYAAPYRRAFAKAKQEEEDLFMLLVFSESLGVPNPATFYTLELLPTLYEDFHDWHRRMGLERSPLDGFRCC
jgi:hypothetical protein